MCLGIISLVNLQITGTKTVQKETCGLQHFAYCQFYSHSHLISLTCSFYRGNTEGTNSSKFCVWCLCTCICFVSCLCRDLFCGLTWERVDIYIYICFVSCLCRDLFCGLTWERVDIYIYGKSFWIVHLLLTEFDRPEVTLCGWQDVQIKWLTHWLF